MDLLGGNVDQYCRTCLTQIQTTPHNIFRKRNDGIEIDIADILSTYLSLQIDPLNSFPKFICNTCYDVLASFENFKSIALNIDKKLREQLHCSEIKEEISLPFGIEESLAAKENDNIKHEIAIKEEIDSIEIPIESTLDQENSFSDTPPLEETVNNNENDLQRNNINIFTTIEDSRKLYKLKRIRHKKQETCDNNQETTETVQCDICTQKFKSINSLSAHKRKHASKNRVLMCAICKKLFKKVSHLKRHELTHVDNHPFKCNQCTKSFPLETSLVEHINRHNGIKSQICPVCNKSFSHLSTLNNHIQIHTRDSPNLCQTCGKKFSSSANLKEHMARHMGLKTFACTLCPKKFVSKGELQTHQHIHTEERAYQCDQCSATFTSRTVLRRHKIRHSGYKPHQCTTCPMKFSNKDHLKRHVRIHTGERPYKCEYCERAFKQSNDLVKHKRVHLGINMYRCDQCNRSFRLQTELRKHMMEHYTTLNVEPPGTFSNNLIERNITGMVPNVAIHTQ